MIRPFSYPDLESIVHTYQPQRFLGREIVWEEKVDGSNLMVWLDKDDDRIRVSSRHEDDASEDLQNGYEKDGIKHAGLRQTPQFPNVELMIRDHLRDYHSDLIVFGELLRKGIAPTRITKYPESRFAIFDIYVLDKKRWCNYTLKHQYCFHYDLPLVEALATSNIAKFEELLEFRDRVLEIAKTKGGIEGTVLKTQDGKGLYAKEKLDTPKLEKLPRLQTDGVELPLLPDSEVYGAVDKAFVDLGHEKFLDKRIAMPVVARYVSEEGKKHLCRSPTNIFKYYQQKCEDLTKETFV